MYLMRSLPGLDLEPIVLQAGFDNELLDVTVAPNPFSNTASISLPLIEAKAVQIRIFDMAGRLMYQAVDNTLHQARSGTRQISVGEELRPGIYLLEIVSGSAVNSVRIIKS
jgi:hypothetical protein